MGTAAFTIGVVAQALILCGTRWRRTDLRWLALALAAACAGALVGVPAGWAGMPPSPDPGQVIAGRALAAAAFGMLALSLRMRERVLPHVNAAVVAYLVFVCLGLVLSKLPPEERLDPRTLRALSPMVLAGGYAVWLSITRERPSAVAQGLLYLVYLGCVVAFLLLLPTSGPSRLLDAITPDASARDASVAGAYVAFVMAHLAMSLMWFAVFAWEVWRKRGMGGSAALLAAFDQQFLGDSKRALVSTLVLSALGIALVVADAWSPAATEETARVALAFLPLATSWLIRPVDIERDERQREIGEPPPPRGVLRPPGPPRPVTRARVEQDRARHRGKRGRRGW